MNLLKKASTLSLERENEINDFAEMVWKSLEEKISKAIDSKKKSKILEDPL